MFLGSTAELGGELAAAFSHTVDSVALDCVKEVALGLPLLEASAACHTFQDWAKLLPAECFCSLLQAVGHSSIQEIKYFLV